MSAPLSARIRAGSEAAPWVVAEVRKLEEVRAAEAARHQQELSDERIGRLFAEGRIATLRATVAADDERLRAAGARVGVEYGCDTADWMAERILELRATADQQQARIRELEENAALRAHLKELQGWKDRTMATALEAGQLLGPEFEGVSYPEVLRSLQARITALEQALREALK